MMMNIGLTAGVMAGLISYVAEARAETQDSLRLGLKQAMEMAREQGYRSLLAQSKTGESREKIGVARSALLPHIGATANDVVRSFNLATMGLTFPTAPGAEPFPNLVGPFNTQDARVNGRLTIIDASAWMKYGAARLDWEQSQLDERASGDADALAAAEAYLALARARALAEARKMDLDLASRLADLSRAQLKAGTATRLEVLRADGQVSSARSALSAAVGGEEQARYVLLRLLGLDMSKNPSLTDSLGLADSAEGRPASKETPIDSQLASAMAGRPEVAAADKQAEAARAELGGLRSELFPTLDLGGDYGLSGRRLNGRAEWTETVALQLNWNLWDGGSRRARLGQQAEKLRQAEIKSREARAGVEQEIRSAAAAMRASREQVLYARERVALAEEEAKLAEERFRSGASGNLEVITAQGTLSLAHEANLDALFNYNRARLEFLRAAHRLSDI